MSSTVTGKLQGQGFYLDKSAPIKLVIDIQRGFALHTLEMLDRSARPDLRLIVVTYNQCPEYWEDLWDLHPDVLIVDAPYSLDYADAIMHAARDEEYRVTSPNKTRLTPGERQVFQGAARGWSNKQIAQHAHLQEATVANALTPIYRKLGIKNRLHASLYYMGSSSNLW